MGITPRPLLRLAPVLATGALFAFGSRAALSAPETANTPPAPAQGAEEAPRVAVRSTSPSASLVSPKPGLEVPPSVSAATDDPIFQARRAIADCRAKYAKVVDYTCTFSKRERIEGKLYHPHVMDMKARANPSSVYFKFRSPNKGREAIYVAGRNGGKLLAHDVGIGKFLAGTMNLDPLGSMAMEDCRHPITEAGIGALIETVTRYWAAELTPDESVVVLNPNMTIGPRPCTLVETVHPAKQANFLYHKVRLYIDREYGLPVRYEAYDWPKHPGAAADLLEEYDYHDLRLNVGLGDADFDANNKAYSFGRF